MFVRVFRLPSGWVFDKFVRKTLGKLSEDEIEQNKEHHGNSIFLTRHGTVDLKPNQNR